MTTTSTPASTPRVKTRLPDEYTQPGPQPLADFLGLFSLALGATEIFCPGRLARLIGFPYDPTVLQAYGLREVVSGAGILLRDRPAGWLWARVAGDVLDLATIAVAYERAGDGHRPRLVAAAAAVAGVAALDLVCAADHSGDEG
jgi:hypothetical protein